ncbi:hypothetical protein, partial [Nocardia blacklockiae]|uniref:hypothetical protein n=1 Tax=Nocardia blacklockiae TaxID=480036 RepID=UPI001E310F88
IKYKPGKENIVADALSKQNLNIITNQNNTSKPINHFRNQICITFSYKNKCNSERIFQKYLRHNKHRKSNRTSKESFNR